MNELQKILLTLWTACTCLFGFSQNIVPNYGFESASGVPGGLGQWSLCQEWNNVGSLTADPDYYHVSGSGSGDLPVTPAAIINPRSGNAIMGFMVFNKFQADFREYLSIQLTEALVPGQKYLVSFFVSNGEVTATSNAGIGVSEMGVHLSVNSPVQTGNGVLAETPQHAVSGILYDRNWRKVQFTFLADAPHSFLTVGVFKPDSDIQFAEVEGDHPNIGYYFVDDFIVRMVQDNMEIPGVEPGTGDVVDDTERNNGPTVRPTGDLPFYIPNSFTPNNDGVNDVFGPIINHMDGYELSIFDRWGSLVFQTTNCKQGWDGKSKGNEAESGLYVWQINYHERGLNDDKQVRSCRGSVNLLR